MESLIRTFITVMPILLLPAYFSYQEWGTERKRKIVGVVLGLVWAVLFGWFTGSTDFLRH
ncbi:hypothetical protein MCEMSE6_00974 [Oxalobacteraceae bacterium]